MRNTSFPIRKWWVAVLLISVALPGFTETKSLLILHTNDLHARIRPGHDDTGGMPYISGYMHQVREQRQDVLAMDAGDVTEKGDMLSFLTHNTVMYEAMNAAGYDIVTPGNHDMRNPLYLDDGVKAAPHITFVCMNCYRPDGSPRFEPSKIISVNGIRVAVIGLTVKTGDDANSTINDEECMNRLVKEVDRVEPLSDIQIILCHLGSEVCQKIAQRVPAVDLYVSGHTHELLNQPIRTDAGALIVQTGEYAQNVGRVDLLVDLESRKITQANVEIVKMDHTAIPCDKDLLAAMDERTKSVCPEANRVITRCSEALPGIALGQLTAEALRRSANTDICLLNAPHLFRADLPQGDISIGDIFLAGGFRGHNMVTTSLSGEEIEAYLIPEITAKPSKQSWSGFDAKIEFDQTQGKWIVKSSLDPRKQYSVITTALEWRDRCLRKINGAENKKVEPSPVSFIDAIVNYITTNISKDTFLNDYIKSMPKNGCEMQ